MLWIIIVVLIVLWLLGFFGPVVIPNPATLWPLGSYSDCYRCDPHHSGLAWCNLVSVNSHLSEAGVCGRNGHPHTFTHH